MVKKLAFEVGTINSGNDLRSNDNVRNIAHCGTKYWWGSYSGTDVVEVHSCPDDDFDVAHTVEHSYDFSSHAITVVNFIEFLCRAKGNEICIAYSYTRTVPVIGTCYTIACEYSSDGGANWTHYGLLDNLDNSETNDILDIVFFSTTGIRVLYSEYDPNGGPFGVPKYAIFFTTLAGVSTEIDAGFDNNQPFYGGYELDDVYYYVIHVSTATGTQLCTSTAGAVSAIVETLTGITNPSTFNVNKQLYWKQNGIEYLIHDEKFYIRKENTTVWALYSSGATNTFCCIWDYDTNNRHTINYLIWASYVYSLEFGYITRIQAMTEDVHCGFNDFFIDYTNNDVYVEGTAVDENVQVITDAEKPYTPPSPVIMSITQPFTNEYLKFYDDDDILFYQGKIESYEFDFSVYTYKMRSPIEEDYTQPVDVMLASYTGHAALKYLIDTYCKYIWYDTHISTTPTTTYDWDFKNMNLLACIQYIDQRCGYQTIIRPSLEAYWDQGTDSTITIDGDADSVELPNNAYKKIPLKLSLIILKGGWDATHDNFFKVELLGEPNFGTYIDEYPNLRGVVDDNTGLVVSGPLYDMATQILTNRNKEVITILLTVAGKGIFYVGQYVTLTLSQYNITAATYYIMGLTYDPDEDTTDLLLSDSLIIQPPNKNSYGAETPDTQLETLRWNLESIRYHLQYLYEITNSITSPINYWFGNTTLEVAFTNSSTALTETATTDPDTLSNIFFKSAVVDTPTPFTIPNGSLIQIHFNAKQTTTTGAKTAQLYCQLGYVDADGTSNFVQIGANTDPSATLTSTIAEYDLHVHVSTEITVPSGKRLWIKFVADLGGAGNDPEINVYYNDSVSHCQINTYSTFGNFLPKAGGTMSGAIAMGTNKITGLGDPTTAQDAATMNYVNLKRVPIQMMPSLTNCSTTDNLGHTVKLLDTIDHVVAYQITLPSNLKTSGKVTFFITVYVPANKVGTTLILYKINMTRRNTATGITYVNSWNGQVGDTMTFNLTSHATLDGYETFTLLADSTAFSANDSIYLTLSRDTSDTLDATTYIAIRIECECVQP
jgi:hypothetical protein